MAEYPKLRASLVFFTKRKGTYKSSIYLLKDIRRLEDFACENARHGKMA